MSLKKVTVANLEKAKMDEVLGGTATGYTCVHCNSDQSCINVGYNCLWEYTCPPGCWDLS